MVSYKKIFVLATCMFVAALGSFSFSSLPERQTHNIATHQEGLQTHAVSKPAVPTRYCMPSGAVQLAVFNSGTVRVFKREEYNF